MYVMSTWALAGITLPRFRSEQGFTLPADPVPWVGLVLLVLAAVMLVEAVRALAIPPGHGSRGRAADTPERSGWAAAGTA
jgi:hypothetical protein